MSDTAGRDGDAEAVVKFVLFGGAVEAFSIGSVKVSTSGADVDAVVIDDDLSGFTLCLDDTFSSVHEEIVSHTLSAGSGISVVNITELIHFMAEVVISQILSGWALAGLFDLKANSAWLKSVSWNAGQTCSSCIKLIAKIAHSCAFSVIVWNKSGRANNLNAFSLGVVIISPNAFDTFSSELFESLTEWVNINTFQKGIDVLLVGADFFNRGADSGDRFFDGANAGFAGSGIGDPFFAFVVDFIAGPSGFVEEGSSGAGEWGSFAGTVVEIESGGALGALGEIVVGVTSSGVGETLSVFFVLAGGAVLLDASSRGEGVSGVAGCADVENRVVEDAGESGEVSLEETASVESSGVGVFGNVGASVDFSEVVQSVGEVSCGCPIYFCS